ncbi:hypothetical protein ACOME3_000108 [Neoechinorhynchus agilis]
MDWWVMKFIQSFHAAVRPNTFQDLCPFIATEGVSKDIEKFPEDHVLKNLAVCLDWFDCTSSDLILKTLRYSTLTTRYMDWWVMKFIQSFHAAVRPNTFQDLCPFIATEGVSKDIEKFPEDHVLKNLAAFFKWFAFASSDPILKTLRYSTLTTRYMDWWVMKFIQSFHAAVRPNTFQDLCPFIATEGVSKDIEKFPEDHVLKNLAAFFKWFAFASSDPILKTLRYSTLTTRYMDWWVMKFIQSFHAAVRPNTFQDLCPFIATEGVSKDIEKFPEDHVLKNLAAFFKWFAFASSDPILKTLRYSTLTTRYMDWWVMKFIQSFHAAVRPNTFQDLCPFIATEGVSKDIEKVFDSHYPIYGLVGHEVYSIISCCCKTEYFSRFMPLYSYRRSIQRYRKDDKSHSVTRYELEESLNVHRTIGTMEQRRVMLSTLTHGIGTPWDTLSSIDSEELPDEDLVIGLRIESKGKVFLTNGIENERLFCLN